MPAINCSTRIKSINGTLLGKQNVWRCTEMCWELQITFLNSLRIFSSHKDKVLNYWETLFVGGQWRKCRVRVERYLKSDTWQLQVDQPTVPHFGWGAKHSYSDVYGPHYVSASQSLRPQISKHSFDLHLMFWNENLRESFPLFTCSKHYYFSLKIKGKRKIITAIKIKRFQGWRDSSLLKTLTALVEGLSLDPCTHAGQLTTAWISRLQADLKSLASTSTCSHVHIPANRHTHVHIIKMIDLYLF